MRKSMTRVFDEAMSADPNVVYIGEDVEHGGYYVVTEGLKQKYPGRMLDFPPDETSLLGAAIGFSHSGIVPICEIPYAKYLDCGADTFFEAAIANWLSNGKQPNGMLVRLQGFDRGIFGGNFHTHNTLHIPVGVDVVCYSNGSDYAKGMRYSLAQAKGGRMVMSVDCTALLNERHMGPTSRDDGWMYAYPEDKNEVMTFDDVRVYPSPQDAGVVTTTTTTTTTATTTTAPVAAAAPKKKGSKSSSSSSSTSQEKRVLIVSYGNGVRTSLQAAKDIADKHPHIKVEVLDCPYLSGVPQGLKDVLSSSSKYDAVVFADICKEGSAPLAHHSASLHNDNLLPHKWRLVTAQKTYNPLGTFLTFLNLEDITGAVMKSVA